jgi:hypothetical protein
MEAIRFLLPCTANIDQGAINAAVEVASSCGAILVPLLLRNMVQVKTEFSADQALDQDFLDIVRQQAAVMEVPIERIALSTYNAGQSIHILAEEMDCSGILLFIRDGRGVLLETGEVQYVIEHEHIILPFLVHLISKEPTLSSASWISDHFQSKKGKIHRKKAFPRWYPFAFLASGLIISALVYLNGMDLLQEPVFTLSSLLVKLIFITVIALSLVAILAFFVEAWRQKQEE